MYSTRARLQGCTSTLDISHRSIRVCNCPFDFLVERIMSHCQRGHCPVIFLVTLGHQIADPVTGCSPSIRAYIWPINSHSHLFVRQLYTLAHGVASADLDGLHLVLNVHSNLLWLSRDGRGGGVGRWVPMSYLLLATLSPPEWLCIKADSCVRQFNVLLRAKSQDSVHKPHFLIRKKSRSSSNQDRSAYQHSAFTARPHRLMLDGFQRDG